MWNVRGKPVETNWINFTPEKILYEYDGPRTFVFRDNAKNMYLAHWCDEDTEIVRFLVVPFSDDLLENITIGKINVRDALSQTRAWIFDLNSDDWTPISAWKVDVDNLPPGVLPRHGVMLYRHLPSVIKINSLRVGTLQVEIQSPKFPQEYSRGIKANGVLVHA